MTSLTCTPDGRLHFRQRSDRHRGQNALADRAACLHRVEEPTSLPWNALLALLFVAAFLVGGSETMVLAQPARGGSGISLGIRSAPNLRDLGGYVARDGAVVRSGKIYRSDQLSRISPDDLARIAALGLRTTTTCARPRSERRSPTSCRRVSTPSGWTCWRMPTKARQPNSESCCRIPKPRMPHSAAASSRRCSSKATGISVAPERASGLSPIVHRPRPAARRARTLPLHDGKD